MDSMSPRVATLFQEFRDSLAQRSDRIVRACMAQIVDVGQVQGNKFVVTVQWLDRQKAQHQYIRAFTPGAVFFTKSIIGVRLRKPVCRFVDDLIREAQKARGIT